MPRGIFRVIDISRLTGAVCPEGNEDIIEVEDDSYYDFSDCGTRGEAQQRNKML